jgi:hypothetical protein
MEDGVVLADSGDPGEDMDVEAAPPLVPLGDDLPGGSDIFEVVTDTKE